MFGLAVAILWYVAVLATIRPPPNGNGTILFPLNTSAHVVDKHRTRAPFLLSCLDDGGNPRPCTAAARLYFGLRNAVGKQRAPRARVDPRWGCKVVVGVRFCRHEFCAREQCTTTTTKSANVCGVRRVVCSGKTVWVGLDDTPPPP
jgi:hypothetical protein